MRALAIAVGAALLLAACGDDSSTTSVSTLTVSHAWARPTPPGAANGVVYFEITSPTDDALISVSVPTEVAAEAAMHETMGGGGASPMPNMPDMTTAGGEMTMEPLDSVDLPGGTAVVFEPGGKHVMLTGLVAPLVEGDHFQTTFTTKDGHTLVVDVVISANPPKD